MSFINFIPWGFRRKPPELPSPNVPNPPGPSIQTPSFFFQNVAAGSAPFTNSSSNYMLVLGINRDAYPFNVSVQDPQGNVIAIFDESVDVTPTAAGNIPLRAGQPHFAILLAPQWKLATLSPGFSWGFYGLQGTLESLRGYV